MPDTDSNEASLNADRLLGLRRFPGMGELDLQELGKVLAAMTERSVAAGTRLSTRGTPMTTAWFLIEGELDVFDGANRKRVRPGENIGLLEMIGESGGGFDVECVTSVVVLAIEKEDLFALLTDEFEMLVAAIRSLCGYILQFSPAEETTARVPAPTASRPLGFVDRLLFLHDLGTFATSGAETLAELAGDTTDTAVSGILAHAGKPAEHMYIVIDGCLRYGRSELPPGSPFGTIHGLAETPLAFDLVADEGTTVLTCPIGAVIDVLEDDIPLAFTWLRGMANRLVELAAADSA